MYSPAPGHPECGAPATDHVIFSDPAGIIRVCRRHLPIAYAAMGSRFVADHAFEPVCAHPGSRPRIQPDGDSWCELPDDQAPRRAASAETIPTARRASDQLANA